MQRSVSFYARLPIAAQNVACTWAGWRRARSRFTPHFHRRLAEWEKTGSSPAAALHEIQWRRLRHVVERARAHVPHYRDLAPPVESGDPERAIADTLARLPVLEKAAYRKYPESFIARDLRPSRLVQGRTSGTTGTALPLWHTRDSIAEEYASVWRHRRSFGAQVGDANLTFNGQIVVPFEQREAPFWRTNWWGRQTLFSLYHMKEENLRDYIEAIHRTPARYAQGYPSSLHLVGRALLAAGRPIPSGRLAAVFTSSESLLAFQRETIEKAFGAPVRDRYGVSELAVSMTACALNRLHVDMEFCIVEVEPIEETNEFVRGALLVTGLATDATPFLRYRIGDVATRLKRPCECGRPGDVFLDVDGRVEDYVVTPDGRVVGRLDHVFKGELDVAEAQILQEEPGRIEVLVVPRESWGAAAEKSLLQEIRARLGAEIGISLRLVDAIPREPNGKFRAVKSRVGDALVIRVGLARTEPSYRGLRPPYGPGAAYPELAALLGGAPDGDGPNPAYAAVRAALRGLGLDEARFGGADWNPLGELVARGRRAVLKPNFIRHWNPCPGASVESVVTHGSIVRALADYAFLAVGAEGSVTIAEAPQHDCDFAAIRELAGLDRLQRFYRERLGRELGVIDLRRERVVYRDGIIVERHALPGDPAGYRAVDLGGAELLPRLGDRPAPPARRRLRPRGHGRSPRGRPQRVPALRDRALRRPGREPPQAEDPQEDRGHAGAEEPGRDQRRQELAAAPRGRLRGRGRRRVPRRAAARPRAQPRHRGRPLLPEAGRRQAPVPRGAPARGRGARQGLHPQRQLARQRHHLAHVPAISTAASTTATPRAAISTRRGPCEPC